jgi:hypothetical protein
VLVVLRQDQRTGLPKIQLISGQSVETLQTPRQGNEIRHGVELDAQGRQVAYFWSGWFFGRGSPCACGDPICLSATRRRRSPS